MTLNSKPHLLIVLSYFYPYISGVSEYARIAGQALKKDFDVTVLTGKHASGLPRDEIVAGVRIVRAATLVKVHKGYISPQLLLQFIRLSKTADVINLHLPMLEAGAFAWLGRRYAPVVITYHCDVTPIGGFIDWLAVKSVLLSARQAIGCCDGLIVLTKDYARTSPVLRKVAEQAFEIPLIKMAGYHFRPDRVEMERAHRIGFVGRFVREKGIEVILEAMGTLVELIPNVTFVFAGASLDIAGGSLYESIAKRLAEYAPHIEMLGRLSDEELWDAYSELDILLLPSINSYEAFGMVQVEAMLAGALVVASDLRGVRVPIQLTGNGVLVQPGSAKSLIDGIVACHSLRKQRSREEVRARTLRHFCNRTARRRMLEAFSFPRLQGRRKRESEI